VDNILLRDAAAITILDLAAQRRTVSAENSHFSAGPRGYLFSADGTGREIDAGSAAEWLDRKNDGNGEFVWLHFHDIPTALDNCPLQHAVLPEAFAETLREGSHQHTFRTYVKTSSQHSTTSNTISGDRSRCRRRPCG
jgi:hypothetical protein